MKLYSLLESIVKENKSKSCVAEFGKILFGDQFGGGEKNTPSENKHLQAIYKFTDYNFGENIKPEIENAIYNLHKCMRTYPEILMPEHEKVFRGTNVKIMYFIKEGLIPEPNIPQPYKYIASAPIQSWTTSFDVAKIFGDGEDINKLANQIMYYDDIKLNNIIDDIRNIKIPVILEYESTPEDFLFKSKYLNKISEHPNENEVIRIDSKPIYVMAYLNNKWLNNNALKLIKIINQQL